MKQWRTEGTLAELIGMWFVATFATALILAACAMYLAHLLRGEPETGQPWFALLIWGLATIIGLVAARRFRDRRLRQFRLANRLCAVCGYDVRATIDRCPECGSVPTSKT